MKMKNYVAPRIEVIEVENEGVMANSPPNLTPPPGGGGVFQSSTNTAHRTAGSSSALGELEDLINDILTFEK